MVGDGRAVEAHPLADLLLGGAPLGEAAEGVGELDRIEVATLDVLDQRELEPLPLVDVGDDRGNRRQPAARAARQRRSPTTSS